MIEYKAGYKYQLHADYALQTSIQPPEDVQTDYLHLTAGGLLFISKGYAWDGPSGPTIDTDSFMRGSLVHDAIYQLIREGLLDIKWRGPGDKEIRRLCKEDGMYGWRLWYVYRGVSWFAAGAASRSNVKPVLTAP